jgi:putative membrane-bound dehydrogenase-like protein
MSLPLNIFCQDGFFAAFASEAVASALAETKLRRFIGSVNCIRPLKKNDLDLTILCLTLPNLTMKNFARLLSCALLLFALSGTFAHSAIVTPTKRAPGIDPKFATPKFSVPDGFTVELVAGPPLVNHPMMGGFDHQGRLLVSETAGLNLNNSKLDEQLPNYVTLLEDSDGDGFFDKSNLFADKMTFPQGGLWHDGAWYVCSPPGLWRLEDTDDDGQADKREQIATGFAYTGNAADVHGPFLHPNGRLFWCHGRKGHEVYQRDGKTLVSKNKGARIWSCLPDGTDLRYFAGGGMDNPVEVDFTPEGEILGTVNLFYGRPRGDVYVHWLHGGAYPRHDQPAVTDEFVQTGDLLKEVFNYGHVAISGFTHYRSGFWGNEFRGNAFITFFNTHKLGRTVVKRKDASFEVTTHEFLEAMSNDIHFTDVIEDADGSLLLIDTGGWFRIGCPTSQLAKPDVRGAIYRIRKSIPVPVKDPRGTEMRWARASVADLVERLDDRRPPVRDRAREALVKQGPEAVASLARTALDGGETARRNSLWCLSRIETPLSRSTIWTALKDKSASVRQTACNILGEAGDRAATSQLVELLGDPSLSVQREAATALGRIGDSGAIMFLMDQLSRDLPRELEHAILYALIEIGEATPLLRGLESRHPWEVARSLIVLDQLGPKSFSAAHLTRFLPTTDETLRKTLIRVAVRHPDWATTICATFNKWIDDRQVTDDRLPIIKGIAPNYLDQKAGQELVARLLNWHDPSPAIVQLATSLIVSSPNPTLHPDWIGPLRRQLQKKSAVTQVAALDAIAALRNKTFDADLQKLGANQKMPELIRVKAMAGVSTRAGKLDANSFAMLTRLLESDGPIKERTEASRMLSKARLTAPQLRELASSIGELGPIELPEVMPAFYRSRDAEVGKNLVASLLTAPGVGNLSLPELKRTLTHFPPEVSSTAESLIARLDAQVENQKAHLDELESSLPGGHPSRGKKVFASQAAVCSVCHHASGTGGRVGPDLSRIGRIRTKRDLLESLIYPSASLARDFEAYIVDTKDGESQTGVIVHDGGQHIQLAIANGQLLNVPRSQIRDIRASQLSLMPQGLDQTMTKQQLADLVAYLLTLK